jgi:hypothetical protein
MAFILKFNSAGEFVSITRIVKRIPIPDYKLEALKSSLSCAISVHKGLCEAWFKVLKKERKIIEQAIIDKEFAIEELLAKIMEHNKIDRRRV